MSRRDNSPEARCRRLKRHIKELYLDVKAIIEEHDRYRLGGDMDRIEQFFESLPIETLRESLERENGKPRTTFSLRDMHHKFGLRRLHDQKQAELERRQREYNIARMEVLQNKIQKVEGLLDG
jgi:hypothetical protein